jgi:hypothetical protein
MYVYIRYISRLRETPKEARQVEGGQDERKEGRKEGREERREGGKKRDGGRARREKF